MVTSGFSGAEAMRVSVLSDCVVGARPWTNASLLAEKRLSIGRFCFRVKAEVIGPGDGGGRPEHGDGANTAGGSVQRNRFSQKAAMSKRIHTVEVEGYGRAQTRSLTKR